MGVIIDLLCGWAERVLSGNGKCFFMGSIGVEAMLFLYVVYSSIAFRVIPPIWLFWCVY